MNELIETLKYIDENVPSKIILSNNKQGQYKKINIQKNGETYLIEKFTDKQAFHSKIHTRELRDELNDYMNQGFTQLNAFTDEQTFELKISKKGKVFFSKSKNKQVTKLTNTHNRKKNYILEEGTIIPPLVDMGIFTKEGKVVHSMYDKFKQINRFIEQVDDSVKNIGSDEITVIDFGCGKSYLTFILYYYLTEVRGLKANIIGLDLKEDVIQKCNVAAKKYQYDGLSFQMGDINGFKWGHPVDMVITLHACDTATDYALFNAIEWDAKMIFSVPCCQHELNRQIKTDRLSALTRHGIIKERMSALMTDSIRANLLDACGYKTQLLEFVDLSHTPKNILIRAVKTRIPDKVKQERLEEVDRICDEFNVSPMLYKLLKGSDKLS